jgi:hypothetical protein
MGGGCVVSVWALWEYGRRGLRLSFADEKKMKRVLVHACCLAHGASSALRAMLIRRAGV